MSENDRLEEMLKPKQYRAITVLTATGIQREAAKAAGVSERTLRRWMEDPAFRGELITSQTEIVNSAACRLGQLSEKAVTVLEALLDDDKVAPNVRVRAAALALDTAPRWREQIHLEGRLMQIEQLVER